MNNQIKTNALISYFFLGWIFLLAGNNPNFSHEFIVKHSKKATKIHFGFLAIFIVYNMFLSRHMYYNIPLLMISIDKVINLLIFFFLTLAILKGAYLAHKGLEPSNISINDNLKNINNYYNTSQMSETEKIAYISSFLPFFGIMSYKRLNNKINENAVKIGSIFSFLTLTYYIFYGFDSIFILLIFSYVLVIVYAGVNIFINNKLILNNYVDKIPSLKESYINAKTCFFYFFDFLNLIFGKDIKLNYKDKFSNILEKDEKYEELLKNHFQEDRIILSPKLIFIPIINLLFAPFFFFSQKSKYLIAIIQGLIISVLLIFIWIYFGYYSLYQLFLFFPIFIGLANIDSNPFYRIPIIYDIYIFSDKLTFGIFSKVKFLKEKKNEVREVSYKL